MAKSPFRPKDPSFVARRAQIDGVELVRLEGIEPPAFRFEVRLDALSPIAPCRRTSSSVTRNLVLLRANNPHRVGPAL